jgi:hypothetical protein
VKIFNKVIVALALVALALLSQPETGGAQAAEVVPLLKYYSQDYWVLMGGSKGGKWLTAEAVGLQLRGKKQYRLYSLTGPAGTALGSKAGSWGQADPPFLVRIKPILRGKDMVAVGGRRNAMPRKPRLLTKNLQPYEEAAKEILKSKGIAEPQVNLTQVIEIDMDGDGVKEVVVSATRFTMTDSNDSPNEGDYSMVFVQKKAKGGANNILVYGQFQAASLKDPGAALTYRVAGLIDANGDGVMEIFLTYSYYEGGGARLYQLKGDKVELVLGEDWGL